MNEVIKGLPVIALKGMTILPYMVIHFDINRKNGRNIYRLEEVLNNFDDSIMLY